MRNSLKVVFGKTRFIIRVLIVKNEGTERFRKIKEIKEFVKNHVR